MFRKLTIALAATAALGAAALAPTSASAGWKHKHHHWKGPHWSYGVGYLGPVFAAGGDCYYIRRVVYTSHGKRYRRVLVCN